MAGQSNQGRRRARQPAADDGHRVVDIDEARRRAAAPDVQKGDDPRAGQHDHLPAVDEQPARPAPDTVAGLKALERSQWAILKELRLGRKYREANPPKLAFGLEHECEQCGTSRATFDDLVHHQFAEHPDVFVEAGELMLETPACMCHRCAGVEPYLVWLRTTEARGAKG